MMFRNRKNSQKPDDELITRFQKTFQDVVPPVTSRHAAHFGQVPVGPITPARLSMDGDLKPNDITPRATHDMRFAQSYVDPNAVSYINPMNPHGYYTPNSGGLGAVYHSQAGDLHTPGMGLSMITPLSLPQQLSATTINADPTTMGLEHFNPHFLPPHFHNPQPFAQPATFAPGAFVPTDTGYDTMDESVDGMSLTDVDMHGNATTQFVPSVIQDDQLSIHNSGESFRYHVTLRAPTAMINHQAEIPVTYLNKGQAYSISVVDSTPPPMTGQPLRYRTYIRVSFQEEEQRAKPGACWQLWKEGRGSNEAHQRGGKLQAVEYVDPTQGGVEDPKNRQIQLESASFDGFCVTWTANPTTGISDCAISVRFNFLSTDFSHSKGVKGIPVRLCAKTEMLSPDEVAAGSAKEPEVCYCKVKLFRDHGAERKLSNDVAHVKKTIDKLRQQITQAELGAGNYGKRKRSSGSVALKGGDPRPAKITKHKRTWSMSSQDGPGKMSLEDDLHAKLALMQDMFTSTRPVSILGLRGEEEDDPDLFPVALPESREFIKRENSRSSRFSIDGASLHAVSPTSSSVSLNSPCHPPNSQSNLYYDSGYHGSMNNSRENSRPCSEAMGEKVLLKHPVKVQKVAGNDNHVPVGYIEAVDIDPTYRPPTERPVKPIACFYVRFPRNDQPQDDYYRAVYLTERTVRDLMEKISMKQRIDPRRIVRVLHVKQNGLKIMVDDDVVRELPDGQDMVVEISETSSFESAAAAGAESPKSVEVKLSY
ncbi:CP2 transcription factor [Aspergillus uvarum CBS 121591]|uniref:CP2 transcription factor n=1 Tax=Aspergillus uvarum CBS 121591 TaxID=1448315 RepID=A0A319BWV0_9EURO|nr:CP2 transcription factor [Aspergillus uvarum CBS 121591]PYH76741.1 CP2 transcription factor [Aspergillus uvarum CBS 121591]